MEVTKTKQIREHSHGNINPKISGATMLCNEMLLEVVRRKASGQRANLLGESDHEITYMVRPVKEPKKIKPQKLSVHSFGGKYSDITFTNREADCIILLVKGKTVDGIAKELKLSPRTIEYHLENMKKKTGCHTKYELIDFVYTSDFLKSVVF